MLSLDDRGDDLGAQPSQALHGIQAASLLGSMATSRVCGGVLSLAQAT